MRYHYSYGIRIIDEDNDRLIYFQTDERFGEDRDYFEKYRKEVVESEENRSKQEVIYIPAIRKRVKVHDVNLAVDNVSCILRYKTDDVIKINGKQSNHSLIIEEHYYAKE